MRRVLLVAAGLAVAVAAGLAIRSGGSPRGSASASPEPATPVERAPVVRQARAPALPAVSRRRPAVAGLAADLVAADPNIRIAAVREVARDPDGDPQALLVAGRDPDPSVAGIALGSLGTLHADGRVATADLVALARDTAGRPRLHTMALNALGTVPSTEAATYLAGLAGSTDVGVRRAATALLGSQPPDDAIPALIRALGDDDEYVRDNARNGLRGLSRGRDFGADAGAWQAWWQARR